MSLQGLITNARLPLPLTSLTLTGSGAVYARDAANQFSISLPTTVITYVIEIPLMHQFPYRLEVGPSTAAVGNLVGLKVRSILLWYTIGSVNAGAHTLTIAQEAVAGGTARAAAVAAGGTLTYNTNDGASATLPTAFAATPYKTMVSLATPLAPTTDLIRVNAEWTITNGSGGNAKIHGVTLIGDFGLYF